MDTDKLRLFFTYGIAALVLIGIFVLIFIKLPDITPEALMAVVTTALGFVLGFLFNRESSVGGARDTSKAFKQGSDTALATPPEGK